MENGIDKVITILESICPKCNGHAHLIEISGTKAFLADHNQSEIDGREWEPSPDGYGDVGVFVFRCDSCGHKPEAYATSGGDWVAA